MTILELTDMKIVKIENNELIISIQSLHEFNLDVLSIITSIIYFYEENKKSIANVKIEIINSIVIDKISSAYIKILGYYFEAKGIKILMRLDSLETINSNVSLSPTQEFKNINIENEIKRDSLNLYKLEGNERFTEVVSVLVSLVLEKNLVIDDSKVQEFLSTTIGEVFANAINHSRQETYYFFYDILYQDANFYLDINVIDFGTTLCRNVKEYYKKKGWGKISSTDTIKWAIQSGNTTRNGSGGYGLAMLIDYIKTVNGTLIILSDDAYYSLDDQEMEIIKTRHNFPGTVVKFAIKLYDLDNILTFKEGRVSKQGIKSKSNEKINLDDI